MALSITLPCVQMLWQLQDVLTFLKDVGFAKTRVFMETVDKEGSFTGEYEERAYPVYQDNGPNWFQAVLVACKQDFSL